ncbi:MAG: hypothetical protein LBT84_01095 [Spirochaetia bacterium]|jgi:hypothetical protein|nr:hypothetical protein [Spirochaetia bacterium]
MDIFIIIIIIIIIIIWIEWIVGKFIGESVSHGAGMIIGIIGILLGFPVVAGIACILYSQKNRSGSTMNINLNSSLHPDNIQSSPTTNDTKICPYCAETIKKKATICRFCGKPI